MYKRWAIICLAHGNCPVVSDLCGDRIVRGYSPTFVVGVKVVYVCCINLDATKHRSYSKICGLLLLSHFVQGRWVVIIYNYHFVHESSCTV